MLNFKKMIAAAACLCITASASAFTPLSSASAANLLGDINNDNRVNIADLVSLQRYLFGSDKKIATYFADMNGDWKVDIFDFIMLRSAVGDRLPLPAPDTVANNLCSNIEKSDITVSDLSDEYILAQTGFSLDLLKRVSEPDENVLISPYSISQALAMAASGADGDTKTEMENAMGGIPIDSLNSYLAFQRLNQPDDDLCRLNTANSIWAKNGAVTVQPEFLQKMTSYFDAEFYEAPFDQSTVDDINSWVNYKTNKMIPSLIDTIYDDTDMFLIDAVAFDAQWETPFEKYDVREGSFTASNGSVETADFMASDESIFISDENAQGFIKLYAGGTYGFAALLPDEGLTPEEYISGLTAESLHNTLSDVSYTQLVIKMPKFSYEYKKHLPDALMDMGMKTAFQDNADFRKMAYASSGENLYISDVLHKTFIDVNESGTRAAAVTSVAVSECSIVIPKNEIILDRPFVYAIVDMESGLPVFIGTVNSLS